MDYQSLEVKSVAEDGDFFSVVYTLEDADSVLVTATPKSPARLRFDKAEKLPLDKIKHLKVNAVELSKWIDAHDGHLNVEMFLRDKMSEST